MEFIWVDSDSDKNMMKKGPCLYNALILVGLLLIFNFAADMTQLSQGYI